MTENGLHHPLVDPAVLARLRVELQPDTQICDRFIRDYAALLPGRLDRLHQAVETPDQEACIDAVLSLKISSLMIGAARMADLAAELESVIAIAPPRKGQGPTLANPAAVSLLTVIRSSAAPTIARLAAEISG